MSSICSSLTRCVARCCATTSPKSALAVYAMLFNKLLVLFGVVLPPDVLVATLTPLTTVLAGCSISFALGRLASTRHKILTSVV
jgi:hypothetical protein